MTELLTPQDIAQLLRLPARTTSLVVRRSTFPAPVINESQKLRRWAKTSVEQWMIEQEKRNG